MLKWVQVEFHISGFALAEWLLRGFDQIYQENDGKYSWKPSRLVFGAAHCNVRNSQFDE